MSNLLSSSYLLSFEEEREGKSLGERGGRDSLLLSLKIFAKQGGH